MKLLEEEGHTPLRLQLYADIKGERVDSGLGYLEARPPLPHIGTCIYCGGHLLWSGEGTSSSCVNKLEPLSLPK